MTQFQLNLGNRTGQANRSWIDGCFLKCIGRILENEIDKEKIIQIDINPMHKKFSDVFLYTDVPEETRKDVARNVADKILEMLKKDKAPVN